MKVLVVNKFFFLKGGAETVFFQEREMLKSFGVDVIDFSMQHEKNWDSSYADFFVENVDYHQEHSITSQLKTAFDFIHNSEACRKIKLLIQQEQPDIVHFHNIYHQLTPSVIKVAKSLGCKTVLTAHDTKMACPSYTMYREGHVCEDCLVHSPFSAFKNRCYENSVSKSFLLMLEAFYQQVAGNYQSLDAIISPSAFLANIIRRKYPKANIKVIVNGIDENVVYEDGRDLGYFLYLGRLSKEKGVETLAKAHQMLAGCVELKIVGDGPLYQELERNYPQLQLLGFKQGQELLDLIKGAKAIIVPSECYENCSMSVLEAMAYGKPVIGANIGGIPEQVRHNIEGILFEAGNPESLADAMLTLHNDSELVSNLGSHSRQRLVEKYSLTKHKEDLIALYHQLAAGNK
ncbi:TPA: glycosyltransferase family 4 protein [Photobacterium damselae]